MFRNTCEAFLSMGGENNTFAELIHGLFAFALIALTISAPGAAASAGWVEEPVGELRLDGEVVKAEVERDSESRIYHVKLKMRFTNTGEKPVILLLGPYGEQKEWWVLDSTLSRSLQDSLEGKPFYLRPTGPGNSQSLPKWRKMRRQLSGSRPPPALTETIQPNETFEREIEPLVVIRDTEQVAPGSRVWLTVSLEMWPANIEPGKLTEGSLPYGESLRRKWSRFGDLRLKPILSSPIPFDLP
jgi:hypothetical protein